MERTVRREYIDRWIEKAGTNGLGKLAIKSQVSTRVIADARVGAAPKKEITRKLLCDAIGVSEDKLFPPVTAGAGRMSG